MVGRLLAVFVALPVAGYAWEFSPNPICTLFNDGDDGKVVVTYDPAIAEYKIALTLETDEWSQADSFGIAFSGRQEIVIGTNRHQLSDDRKTLSVRDKGFGNVLNGLEFNDLATARSGDSVMVFTLAGASGPVQAFRACLSGAMS